MTSAARLEEEESVSHGLGNSKHFLLGIVPLTPCTEVKLSSIL